MEKIEFERAFASPTSSFKRPLDVLAADLTIEEKTKILEQWEMDARALQVASEENMSGGELPRLAEVRDAIRRLAPSPDQVETTVPGPTKTGGGIS